MILETALTYIESYNTRNGIMYTYIIHFRTTLTMKSLFEHFAMEIMMMVKENPENCFWDLEFTYLNFQRLSWQRQWRTWTRTQTVKSLLLSTSGNLPTMTTWTTTMTTKVVLVLECIFSLLILN